MMNPDLLFFCPACGNKPLGEELLCDIKSTFRSYKKGEYLAYQGDKVAYLYMLSKGRVKTEIVSESGLTLHVEEIAAPYPLAAAFLFADNNRFPVDVIALEDVDISLISKASVEKQMTMCPHFLRGFMAFNANRTQFLSERLKVFSQKGIKGKLAYYIVQREKNGRFELGRTVAALAEYFGVERPSLSRAISEMVRDGVICYEKGKGKILDYEAIKEMLG